MAITQYRDAKSGKLLFKVRIVRKSILRPGTSVEKKENSIESLALAQKIELKLIREAELALSQKEFAGERWGKLTVDWYNAVVARDVFARPLSQGALEEYFHTLRIYTHTWKNLALREIERSRGWQLLDKVERDVSKVKRIRLRTAIDSVVRWALLSGRVKDYTSPCEGFESTTKLPDKLPPFLNFAQMRILLTESQRSQHEFAAVWAVAMLTGMRSGELYALRWDAVDFVNKAIYVHLNWTNKTGFGPTKGRYWRSVPMSEELNQFLRKLKKKSEGGDFVLPRIQMWEDGEQAQVIRTFCVGIGLPAIKFHTLRACFATLLIRDGIAPAVVMNVCGWKDLKTMQRYIRFAGIEVKGATDGLQLLSDREVMARAGELIAN